MEKNNGKVIAVVALVVAVVALSVGFAAFTDALNISGNASIAKPEDTVFAPNFGYKAGSMQCRNTATSATVTSAGTVSGNTWSGISVPLSMDQKSVTCTAVVENASSYDAYLKSITASTALGCDSTGTDAATNKAAVCANVQASVQVGETATNKLTINTTSTELTKTGLSQTVPKKATNNGEVTVTVVIEYTGTETPDGDITITLPEITHSYSTSNS